MSDKRVSEKNKGSQIQKQGTYIASAVCLCVHFSLNGKIRGKEILAWSSGDAATWCHLGGISREKK